MKRIIAFALVLIFCFSFASCAKEEAPDGMYLVSGDGEPFKLFVPNAWKDNTSSGVVSAYFLLSEKITVTARYHTPSEDISLEDYAMLCESEYAKSIEEFSSKGIEDAVVGGENARELVFEFEEKIEGETVDYVCRQIFIKYNGDFITLSFYCPKARYEEINPDQFDKIVEEFKLCEKEEDTGDEKTDKKTPDGMKIASADKLEYVMYVPTSWICNSESGASEAYYPESGKPNVTLNVRSSPDFPVNDKNEPANIVAALISGNSVKVVATGHKNETFWAMIEYKEGEYYFVSYSWLTPNPSGEKAPLTLAQLLATYPDFKGCAEKTVYAKSVVNCNSFPGNDDEPAKKLAANDAVTVVAEGNVMGLKWYIFRTADGAHYFAAASMFTEQAPTVG